MLGVQSAGPTSEEWQTRASLRVAEFGSRAGLAALPAAPHAGPHACAPTAAPSDASGDAGDAADAAEERDAWVVLLAVPGLGPVTFAGLLAAFGSARATLAVAAGPNGAVRLQEAMAERPESGDSDVEAALPSTTSRMDFLESLPVDADGEVVPSEPAHASWDRGIRRSLGTDLACKIRQQVGEADRALAVVRAMDLTVVTLDDAEYPERLRRVDMPPPLLFVRGALAALTAPAAVAVVGTRWPTDKGRMIAGWIGSALARAGAVVVSGLAVGIDGAAHAAVVAEGMPTVAVLGGGHARLFPRAHERLAEAIVAAGGAVVAELPPETPATRGTFPRRNRLVSGLSDATVVVEAGRRSGALITAGWALEQGRECFLVPGPLDAPTSEGCHAFLRSFPGQTRVVCGIPELMEDLGLGLDIVQPNVPAAGDPAPQPCVSGTPRARARHPGPAVSTAGTGSVLAALAPVERSVAELLTAGPASADDLAARSGLSGAAILSALTLLELRGLVVGSYGRYLPAGALARWPGRRPARNP